MAFREAERRSRGKASTDTIRAIVKGTHSGKITDPVAEGLAHALDLPVSAIYAAAGVIRPGGRWKWPARFDRLDPAQRRAVEAVAAAILDAAERDPRHGR